MSSVLFHLNPGVPEKCLHVRQIFTWKAFNFFFLFPPDPSGFISFVGKGGPDRLMESLVQFKKKTKKNTTVD